MFRMEPTLRQSRATRYQISAAPATPRYARPRRKITSNMPPTSASSLAERLLRATAVLALVHHIDHVLRVDNNGWPFRSEITPFTYSFLVYAVIAAVWFTRGRPRVRLAAAAALMATTVAHLWLDSPSAQYITWSARPEANWLAASSPALGVAAVLVTFLVPLAAAGTLAALVRSRGV